MRAVSCGMTAICLATSLREKWLTSRPFSATLPEGAFKIPVSARRSVLLPQPFGPVTPTKLPRERLKLTSRMTGVPP